MNHFIFTYGTLKRGFHNHHLLQEATFVSHAITREPRFEMVQLQSRSKKGVFCPAVVSGSAYILGEIYCVNDKGIGILDKLEEQNIRYARELVQICSQEDQINNSLKSGTAWMYEHILPEEKKYPNTQVKYDKESNTFKWTHRDTQ